MATTLGFYFAGLTNEEANDVRAKLNELAASLGYIARTGPTAGHGNAAALLVAIAKGDATVRSSRQQPESLFDAAARVATEIKQHDTYPVRVEILTREAQRIHAFLAPDGPRVQNDNVDLWMHALRGVLKSRHEIDMPIRDIQRIVSSVRYADTRFEE